MYTLYLDKPEDFICEVSVKNASLKNSIARLIVESPGDVNLVFNGKIEGGKCTIPIRRLKGLLDENVTGKMFLEVIVEDTYFKPWESDFSVEEHTSVKVTVNENKQVKKPIVEVKAQPLSKKPLPSEKKVISMLVPLHEIVQICKKFDINRRNIGKKKAEFQQLINEYFNANAEFKNHKRTILRGLKEILK